MILIITHKEDFTTDFVVKKLNERKIDYLRFNCEDIVDLTYEFSSRSEFSLVLDSIDSFQSVWFRRTKLPNIDVEDDAEKIYLLSDYESLLENFYSLLKSKKWLSYPKDVYEAENKLYQLKTAKELGFNVPETVLSNEYNRVKSFIESNNNNVIIKPLRQGRIPSKNGFKTIFTNKLDERFISKLERFDLTPSILQEYIEKAYELRVTVVGDKVFAAKVDSQKIDETKVDWRKKKTPFQRYDLPEKLESMCIQLVSSLNISFGAIDLIRKPNGEFVFLEINPNGQWAWLESELNLPISDEIINFLTS